MYAMAADHFPYLLLCTPPPPRRVADALAAFQLFFFWTRPIVHLPFPRQRHYERPAKAVGAQAHRERRAGARRGGRSELTKVRIQNRRSECEHRWTDLLFLYSLSLSLSRAMGKGPELAVKREEASTSPRAAAPAAQAGSKRQKPSEEEAGGDGDAQGEGSQPPAKRVKSEVEAPSRPSRPMPTTMEAVEDIDLADLDDELDEMMGGAGDDTTKDVVLAQVEKKFESKNKYRFQFRAGIMQIDGLEYVFERGSGDFKW